MLTIKNSFYNYITFAKFLKAYYKSIKGKGNKKEILVFYYNLENNLITLMDEVSTFKYKSSPYRDRVVETWYVENIIKPYFVPRFIYDNYACLENKGTHKAVKRLQHFIKSMREKYGSYYVVKFDIKHFFDSIDKDILFNILSKYITDKYVLLFTYNIIYSNNKSGLPIGNYSSQYFANIYMNELDHYIKDVLHIKFFCRFMDDFVILVKDKVEARKLFDLVEIFVNNNLKLELNKKSCYYPNKLGIDFCGYIIHEDYILVRKRCIRKIKGNIKAWNKLFDKGILDNKKFILSFNSFLGHISHANTYNLKCKVIDEIKFLENK